MNLSPALAGWSFEQEGKAYGDMFGMRLGLVRRAFNDVKLSDQAARSIGYPAGQFVSLRPVAERGSTRIDVCCRTNEVPKPRLTAADRLLFLYCPCPLMLNS